MKSLIDGLLYDTDTATPLTHVSGLTSDGESGYYEQSEITFYKTANGRFFKHTRATPVGLLNRLTARCHEWLSTSNEDEIRSHCLINNIPFATAGITAPELA